VTGVIIGDFLFVSRENEFDEHESVRLLKIEKCIDIKRKWL
jgi:hypothetical protein